MRSVSIGLALVLLASDASLAPASPRGDPQPPNVLLIVLDDVGFEKLDWWPFNPLAPGQTGYPLTPVLQSLASEGVLFTNYWSDPSCSPARCQILTGRDAHRVGIGAPMRPDTDREVADDELFLPELIRLGNPAYRTGAFGKWHLGTKRHTCHPLDNGFEVFQGTWWNTFELHECQADPSTWDERGHHFYYEKIDSLAHPGCPTAGIPFDPPAGQASGPYPMSAWGGWSSTDTTSDVLAWIQSIPSTEPFFAYVAYSSPHEPLQVPPFDLLSPATVQRIQTHPDGPFDVGDLLPCVTMATACKPCMNFAGIPCAASNSLYQPLRVEFLNWMIESIDTEILHLMQGMGSRWDDTVVVVVSDNGTAQTQVDCPLNPRHAKLWPYQPGARVPMFVWGPRVVPQNVQGRSCERLVSAVDLWRTIAEITGMTQAEVDAIYALQPMPPGGQATWSLDSRSCFPLIQAPSSMPANRRETALIEWFEDFRPQWEAPPLRFRRAVVHESGVKYDRLHPTPSPGNLLEEFLDITSDPTEFTNIALMEGGSDALSPCLSTACPPVPPCTHGPYPQSCPIFPCPFDDMRIYGCQAAGFCPLIFMHVAFESTYVPLFCPASSSN